MSLNPNITVDSTGTLWLNWTPDPSASGYLITTPTGSSRTFSPTASKSKLGKPPTPITVSLAALDVTQRPAESASYPAAPPPVPSGTKLSWAPAHYVGGDPSQLGSYQPGTKLVTVSDSNPQPALDASTDYLIRFASPITVLGAFWVKGGRNVAVVGGEINMNVPEATGSIYDHTAVKVRGGSKVHIEGMLVGGATSHDAIVAAAVNTDLTLQNCRVTAHHIQDGHPDGFQVQGGLKSLRIDRYTVYVSGQDAHGVFLKVEGGLPVGPVDLLRVNIHGAVHAFWQETADIGPITIVDYWIGEDQLPFGINVWPDINAQGQTDPNRRAHISSDGTYLTFTNSNITGRINNGNPPAGDWVPAGVAGMAYVPPGYA